MTDPWMIQNSNEPKENDEHDGKATEQVQASERQSAAGTAEAPLEFEDNFAPGQKKSSEESHQPLPDSESYLQGLERKLQKLKKSTKLVEALAEKRQDCLRSFMQADAAPASDLNTCAASNNNEILELDTPISNGDSTVQDIYRLLQPVQAVTVGETVHIVNYDQLEQQRQEAEEDETASR